MSLRVMPAAANSSHNRSIVASVLCASPLPTTWREMVALVGRCAATSTGTPVWVISAMRRTVAGTSVASSPVVPPPTTTS